MAMIRALKNMKGTARSVSKSMSAESIWSTISGVLLAIALLTVIAGLSLLSSHIGGNATDGNMPDVAICGDPAEEGFQWGRKTLRRYRSNVRGAYAQLRLQFGNQAAAEENFLAAVLVDPCNSRLHFNLGTLRQKRGDYDGAEASYYAVVQVDPQDGLAHLLYNKIRQQKAQAEFWGMMAGILQENPRVYVNDAGTLEIPPESKKRVSRQLRNALNVTNTWAPVRLVMNLDRISDGHLQELFYQESTAFERECEGAGKLARKLPTALQQIRQLENSTEWLVPWAVERLRYFSTPQLGMSTGAYGITWFSAWKNVFTRPSVAAAFRSIRSNAVVMIVGSALGYQCLYALALGAKKCIGYDVLCNTLVSNAQKIVEQNDLSSRIEYRCADARQMKGIGDANLVWINDETFPQELRLELHEKVARELEPGSLAVSFSIPAEPIGKLAREDALRVEVSWSFVSPLFIFRKLAPGEMPRPPLPSLPGGAGAGGKRGRYGSRRNQGRGFEF